MTFTSLVHAQIGASVVCGVLICHSWVLAHGEHLKSVNALAVCVLLLVQLERVQALAVRVLLLVHSGDTV